MLELNCNYVFSCEHPDKLQSGPESIHARNRKRPGSPVKPATRICCRSACPKKDRLTQQGVTDRGHTVRKFHDSPDSITYNAAFVITRAKLTS